LRPGVEQPAVVVVAADRLRGAEIELRPRDRLRPVHWQQFGIDGQVLRRADLQCVTEHAARLRIEVEVRMLRRRDRAGRIDRGADLHRHRHRIGQRVDDIEVQRAGEALVAVRAVEREGDRGVALLRDLPAAVAEAVRAAVELVA
jgi:hypothetical protein